MRDLKQEARDEFDEFIEKWCGKAYPHLVDSDGNDGERFRLYMDDIIEKAETAERNRLMQKRGFTYTEWCEDLMGKCGSLLSKGLFRNGQYEKFQLYRAIITDQIRADFDDEMWYDMHRPEINVIIANAISLTLYLKDKELIDAIDQ